MTPPSPAAAPTCINTNHYHKHTTRATKTDQRQMRYMWAAARQEEREQRQQQSCSRLPVLVRAAPGATRQFVARKGDHVWPKTGGCLPVALTTGQGQSLPHPHQLVLHTDKKLLARSCSCARSPALCITLLCATRPPTLSPSGWLDAYIANIPPVKQARCSMRPLPGLNQHKHTHTRHA